jgi:aromatic ring-cleaving dioxygenase
MFLKEEATMNDANPAANRGYHAHIYYDPSTTKPVAEQLCRRLAEQFKVEFGGFRDGPVGPHPIANVQVIFRPEQFQEVVPWLMLNRDSLDILVHMLSEDSVADHSSRALWLGNPVPMKLEVLRPSYRAELLPSAAR